MDNKNLNFATYCRVGNEEQLNNGEKGGNVMQEKDMKANLALLQIYKLEDNLKNKLDRLENKVYDNEKNVAIYINDEDFENGTSKKIEQIKKFCKKHKLNITEQYLDCALVNNYKKKCLNNLIIDAINGKFKTVVFLNTKDMGESSLINTHIINEVFTRNGIRFISIEEKLDTNLDETLIMYENPTYVQLMNFIDNEERKLRAEHIKQGRKMKAKVKN